MNRYIVTQERYSLGLKNGESITVSVIDSNGYPSRIYHIESNIKQINVISEKSNKPGKKR